MISMSVDDQCASQPACQPASQPARWSNPDPASLPGDGEIDHDYKLLNQPAEISVQKFTTKDTLTQGLYPIVLAHLRALQSPVAHLKSGSGAWKATTLPAAKIVIASQYTIGRLFPLSIDFSTPFSSSHEPRW